MNPIVDPLVGLAIGAPFYVLVFLYTWYNFLDKKNEHHNISISKSILLTIKVLILFALSGLLAYLPYYLGFEFYYWDSLCPPRGSKNNCPYGYNFKIFTIFGIMGGAFIFVPIYLFIWFLIDALLLFLQIIFSFVLLFFKRDKHRVNYKKYNGKDYRKFKGYFEKKKK